MTAAKAWGLVGAGWLVVLLLVLSSATGRLGPLQVCGEDHLAICVAWPGLASAALWATFVLTILFLVIWQVAEWRRR